MKVCGIVSEYNPFHNGHQYQIQYVRQQGYTHVAAIMSGHVVQRGDIACLSKWARAKAALENGVDVVLELPAVYSLASAERFAYGAVYILHMLGVVDGLCFGSESGEIQPLIACAKACVRLHDSPLIRELLSEGISYPRAREQAVSQLYSKEIGQLLSAPNNILGVEYIKALLQLKSSIVPFTVKREGVAHDSTEKSDAFASASFIREQLKKGKYVAIKPYVPIGAYAIFEKELTRLGGIAAEEALEKIALYALRTVSAEELALLPDVTEGLENRLSACAKTAVSLKEFYKLVKTKRYTLSRLRRIVYSLMVKNKSVYALQNPCYVRVLGANKRGYEILKKANEKSRIFFSSSFARIQKSHPQFAAIDERATDLFAIACSHMQKGGMDYTVPFIKM